MKKIDKYIDDLFGNDKSPEIIDLKEEIKGHLIDMTNEFINNGLSEEESCNKAIKKFNIDNEILKMEDLSYELNKEVIKDAYKNWYYILDNSITGLTIATY